MGVWIIFGGPRQRIKIYFAAFFSFQIYFAAFFSFQIYFAAANLNINVRHEIGKGYTLYFKGSIL